MAIKPVKKIQIAAVSSHKDKILEILHESGSLHIEDVETSGTDDKSSPAGELGLTGESKKEILDIQKYGLDYANVEYAIKHLSPYGKKRGLLDGPIALSQQETEEKIRNFDFDSIVKKCAAAEDAISEAKNNLAFLQNEKSQYVPWKNLKTVLPNLRGTKRTAVITGCFRNSGFQSVKDELIALNRLLSVEIVHSDEKIHYVVIVHTREFTKEIRQFLNEHKFQETEMPDGKGLMKDYLHTVDDKISDNLKTIGENENELRRLAKHLDDLKIVYDCLGWRLDTAEVKRKIGNTDYSFIINAWIPVNRLEKLEKALKEYTGEFNIIDLPADEKETPPVIIENGNNLKPFEILTRMYGLPKHDELDPTPYLSVFFIIYFALCLTDAAYGIIMFVTMFIALKTLKMGPGVRQLVKLLMYGGVTTIIIGALFGGWFGLEADKVPEIFTYLNDKGERMFLLQQINAITDPLAVMIIALAIGYVQLVFGVYLKFTHNFINGNKLEAVMDSGTWAFMLTGIGFYILTLSSVLPEALQPIGLWWTIIGATSLILTQGRGNKNPVAKILSGVLSLYGLVGYMSDVLSYSRLLALGLATSIIGLAVNVIVGLAINLPYIGWLVAMVIFIGGHSFNLLINALGSFIHSGRLQFVEFFTKFMEGGGKEFTPLRKKTRYIQLINH